MLARVYPRDVHAVCDGSRPRRPLVRREPRFVPGRRVRCDRRTFRPPCAVHHPRARCGRSGRYSAGSGRQRVRLGCGVGDGPAVVGPRPPRWSTHTIPLIMRPYPRGAIPILHFFTGMHGDHHSAGDADRINAAGEARVIAIAERVVRATAARSTRLTLRTLSRRNSSA